MVCKLWGGDGIGPHSPVVVPAVTERTREVLAIAGLEDILCVEAVSKVPEELEFKQGGKALVKRSAVSVSGKHLSNHEDILVHYALEASTLGCVCLVNCVAGIVESLPESLVLRAGLIMVDVLHGIQAEAVNAHIEPFLCGCHNGLEGLGVGAAAGRTVVEVHKHTCAELRIIVVEFTSRHHNGLDVIRVVIGVQGMGNTKLHLVSGLVEAPLGLSCPDILLCGTHKAAPVALVVKDKFVLAGSIVHELGVGAATPVEVTLCIVVGTGSGNCFSGFRYGHLGSACISPVKLYLVALLSLAANKHGEPLVFVVSCRRIHLGNLSGLDIGLRIL